MSATRTAISVPSARFRLGALLGVGAIAAIVAVVVNVVLYVVARNLFDVSFIMPMQGGDSELGPLPWPAIVLFSVVPALIAAAFLWLLARFVRRPLLVFQIVAVVFLILSFGGPISLGDDVDTATKLWLSVMHIVAGAAIIGGLTAFSREQ